jgi:hypothetical protein
VPVILSKAMASYLADPNFSLSLQSTQAMASKSDDMAYLQGTYTMTDPKTKKPMTDKVLVTHLSCLLGGKDHS